MDTLNDENTVPFGTLETIDTPVSMVATVLLGTLETIDTPVSVIATVPLGTLETIDTPVSIVATVPIAPTVYIYGDSHCVIFLEAESSKFKTIVAGYDGASISGLNEITSRLEYGKHITDIVTSQSKTYYHLLKLGQVDLEFIMYHKIYVKKENFTFREFCDSIINKYREFINKILNINKNVIIASINLPSYRSDVDIKGYIRRIISNGDELINMDRCDDLDPILCNFSLTQITKNFMYFNELLRDLAKQLNLHFFDMTDVFIAKDTNSLKDNYKDYGHHYKGYNDAQSESRQVTHDFFRSFFENIE